MVQDMVFNIYDNITFAIYLPNGEILTFQPDNVSPLAPDPLFQISAMFSIS